MKKQKTLNSQNNLEKKNRARGNTLLNFKLFYKVTVKKTIWYWHNYRYIDQWKRIGSPKINSYFYVQLICNQVSKNIQQGKGSLFKYGIGKTRQLHAKVLSGFLCHTTHKNKLKAD